MTYAESPAVRAKGTVRPSANPKIASPRYSPSFPCRSVCSISPGVVLERLARVAGVSVCFLLMLPSKGVKTLDMFDMMGG